MDNINIFKNLTREEISDLLKKLKVRKVSFKKDMTIMSNMSRTNEVGIVLNGETTLVRVDLNGNRSVVSSFVRGDIFGGKFSDYMNEELYIVSKNNCEILFTEYDLLVKSNKNSSWNEQFTRNILEILIDKINYYNQRIEILTKKTTREKLLEYFHILEKEMSSQTIVVPETYTSLAEYLAVDRSAMMREIKSLKDDKIIEIDGKKITLIYR